MPLWGVGAREDWPALGTAVPEELKWRDIQMIAQAGGALYRPGHSMEGPELLAAGDAYGVMTIQPSGDGENGFDNLCTSIHYTDPAPHPTGWPHPAGCGENGDDWEMKMEMHRDMVVHDRNNPSVLAWESNNGTGDPIYMSVLKQISTTWEPVNPRVQSARGQQCGQRRHPVLLRRRLRDRAEKRPAQYPALGRGILGSRR